MTNDLKEKLTEICDAHGFHTLLIPEDMKKLFTDTELDEDLRVSYLNFIKDSDTDAETVDELLKDFEEYCRPKDESPFYSVLKAVESDHGFPTLLVARDMKKLFTDVDLDDDLKNSYINFILESDTSAETVDELFEEFNKYYESENPPLLGVLKKIESDYGFSILLVARDMKKLFTDTNIDQKTRDDYLDFVPYAESRDDVKALYEEFLSWVENGGKPKVNPAPKLKDKSPVIEKVTSEEQSEKPRTYVRKDTRFEKARIIGARALQISWGAPILVDGTEDMLDPIDIALKEYEAGVIPITVLRKHA